MGANIEIEDILGLQFNAKKNILDIMIKKTDKKEIKCFLLKCRKELILRGDLTYN